MIGEIGRGGNCGIESCESLADTVAAVGVVGADADVAALDAGLDANAGRVGEGTTSL